MSGIPLSIVSIRQEIDLVTTFDYPPIPIRCLDWSAIDSNTYDASFEGSDESGDHWKSGPIGHGKTENEAIQDLFDQLEAA
jgi:hypothetical protein